MSENHDLKNWDACRARTAEYARQWRARMREAGLCTTCGKESVVEGTRKCEGCHAALRERMAAKRGDDPETYRQYTRRYREKLRETGICVRCGKNPATEGFSACDECREERRNGYRDHLEYHRIKSAEYRERNRERVNKASRERARRIRRQVIAMYGGACACCGEAKLGFLTIDHINGDGSQDRRSRQSLAGTIPFGNRFYQMLVKEPIRDDLQVLCWNCNCARYHYGVCPHREEALNEC